MCVFSLFVCSKGTNKKKSHTHSLGKVFPPSFPDPTYRQSQTHTHTNRTSGDTDPDTRAEEFVTLGGGRMRPKKHKDILLSRIFGRSEIQGTHARTHTHEHHPSLTQQVDECYFSAQATRTQTGKGQCWAPIEMYLRHALIRKLLRLLLMAALSQLFSLFINALCVVENTLFFCHTHTHTNREN